MAKRTGERRRSGPPTDFPGKDPRPVSLCLTAEGKQILREAQLREGKSRSDVVERLLRKYASGLERRPRRSVVAEVSPA